MYFPRLKYRSLCKARLSYNRMSIKYLKAYERMFHFAQQVISNWYLEKKMNQMYFNTFGSFFVSYIDQL